MNSNHLRPGARLTCSPHRDEGNCRAQTMIVYSLWHLRKLAWRFLDQKEQDQANLKKRSRPNGLRSRHGQDTENAIVIDLMKTAVVWDGGFTPESQSHAD